MKLPLPLGLAVLLSLLLNACKPELLLPATYDGQNFAANTAEEAQLKANMITLANLMKKGRTEALSPAELGAMTNAFNSGSPSLFDATTNYYKPLVSAWLNELYLASQGTFDPSLAPAGDGGRYGSYLFDEHGLELEQLVEKGLFQAALFHQGTILLDGELSLTTVDRILALYGAHPDFPNSDNATKHSNPDLFMARYAARRDPNDGNGLYTRIRQGFIQLQAALAEGKRYDEEADEAVVQIRENWEKAGGATVINYCFDASAKFSATNPSVGQLSGGLHSYGEAVGFLHGLYQVPQAYRLITDAQIAELLELLRAPVSGEVSSYLFITDSFNQVPRLAQVVEKLTAIYAFTPAEVEGFKKNWVNEQGR
jgi:hypothetical protein